MKTAKFNRPGALILISLCFAGSGLIRLSHGGVAIAKEVAALGEGAANDEAASDGPAECATAETPEALLQAIRTRQQGIEAQERQLTERRQVVAVIEKKIEEQLAALKEAETKLSATLAIADAAAENDLARLTAVYENMKPKSAAGIFATMDTDFAAGFLGRMRPDAAAEILASLPVDRAYAISLSIAGRNVGAPVE